MSDISLDAVEIPESVITPVLGASRRVSVLLIMLCDASDMTSAPSPSNVFSDFSILSVIETSFKSVLLSVNAFEFSASSGLGSAGV